MTDTPEDIVQEFKQHLKKIRIGEIKKTQKAKESMKMKQVKKLIE
jgi:hypothetical protein|tara:strand:- start:204 stop:338 length:135 start_codon:yes stop_codon:yes gene_type:complete